jgi:pentapeptide MXKDX repeat protein
LTPEKALQQQNGAIQQYSKMGYQLEAKHQWDKAEKVFEYVLKVSALRDGVGSPKMVPILQHLAVVTSEQGRMQDAVKYQERVLGFAKNQPDQLQIINAGVALTKLYLLQPDVEKAESMAQEVYKLSQDTATITPSRKQEIAHFYGTVLRKLHKDGQAELIDPVVSNKDALNQDALKKDTLNKDTLNKDTLNKDATNKDASTKASAQDAPSTKSN